MISNIPGGRVDGIVVVGMYFRSIISIIPSYVSWNYIPSFRFRDHCILNFLFLQVFHI